MDREVYLKPADVCPSAEVWKLKRCIYGLNDAPRAWYDRVRQEMTQLGATISAFDNAMFLWHSDGDLIGMLVSHVDDFAFCGTKEWHKNIISQLKLDFKISATAQGAFKYVGLNVIQSKGCVKIDQNAYISAIRPISVPEGRLQESDRSLTPDEKSQLRSVAGQPTDTMGNWSNST